MPHMPLNLQPSFSTGCIHAHRGKDKGLSILTGSSAVEVGESILPTRKVISVWANLVFP